MKRPNTRVKIKKQPFSMRCKVPQKHLFQVTVNDSHSKKLFSSVTTVKLVTDRLAWYRS